jgi:hypothetical protein
MTTALASLAAAAPAAPDLPPVRLSAAPSDAWLGIAAGRKGALPDAARHILTAVRTVRFAEVYAGGDLLAIARGAVTSGWFGVSLIEVVPPGRRGRTGRTFRWRSGTPPPSGSTSGSASPPTTTT